MVDTGWHNTQSLPVRRAFGRSAWNDSCLQFQFSLLWQRLKLRLQRKRSSLSLFRHNTGKCRTYQVLPRPWLIDSTQKIDVLLGTHPRILCAIWINIFITDGGMSATTGDRKGGEIPEVAASRLQAIFLQGADLQAFRDRTLIMGTDNLPDDLNAKPFPPTSRNHYFRVHCHALASEGSRKPVEWEIGILLDDVETFPR